MNFDEITLFEEPVGEKTCSQCGETKPKSEFSVKRKKSDGFSSECKACSRKRSAKWQERNRQSNAGRDPFTGVEKRCSRCRLHFPRTRDHWYTNPSNRDGLCDRCLNCKNGKTCDILDRISELWRKERSKPRTKKTGNWINHGKAEWFDLIVSQGGKCPLTGEHLTRDNISIDHIVPVGKGGTHEISNLRLVTLWVNRALSDRDDESFIEMCRAAINLHLNLLCYGTKENPGAS